MKFNIAILFVAFVSAGCGSTAPSLRSQLDASGVSIPELFAQPTLNELSQIRTAWSQRDLTPRDIEEVYREVLADGRLLRVVSHTGTGGKHFGVIVSPAEGTPVPPQGFPVALSLTGFGPPFEVRVSTDAPRDSELPLGITVYPSYRGYRLLVGEQTFESEGPLFDQCDGGTDDVLAFLNVALETTPGASERVVAVGGSRGGNTAMLASARDERIKRVVSLAGPDTYLVESYIDHPNLTNLYVNWFLKDVSTNEMSVDEARTRMIACSPLFFLSDVSPLQLHHGLADEGVPFEVLARVEQAWTALGRDSVDLETYAYEGADHTFNGLSERFSEQIQARINAFVLPVF